MTPCEKLGYKVGDRFEVVKNEGLHNFEIGRRVSLIEDDGTEGPCFEGAGPFDYQFVPLRDVKPINCAPANKPTPKNPIEYLKLAYENGDTINPATMLRECFGITKAERVVTEWSEIKREIKVGDRVRIVGDKFSEYGYGHCFKLGDVVMITDINPECEEQPYQGGGSQVGWLAASDVELV